MRLNCHRSMIDMLRDRAAAGGDKTAVTFLDNGEREGGQLSWLSLDQQSRAIGAAVEAAVDTGARVLILLPPGVEFVPAFFGVLYAGAIALPAYPPSGAREDRATARLRGMIVDAGVTLVLSSADVRARATGLESLIPELASVPWLNLEDVDPDGAEGWRIPRIHTESIALLQYTSGSTSTPRGVMVTHSNLMENLALGERLAGYDSMSVGASWLPVNHDMGLINGVLQPVYTGFPSFLMPPAAFLQRPLRWLQAVSRFGVTHSGGPNFAYDLCVRRISEEERSSLDLSTWRVAYNGSEPVRRQTLETFHRTFATCGLQWSALRPAYGLAESTLLVTSSPEDGAVFTETAEGRALVSSGVASQSRLRIVDPLTRVSLRDGAVGEIWVSGPSVARGYWNKPRESAATFQAFTADTNEGPFLRTGDLGCVIDGRLFVSGRIKDVLIVRGVKHYPQDIEATVERAHPALRPGCCAAFSIERDDEERVIVIAEAEPRRLVDEEEQQRALSAIRRSVAERHQVTPGTIVIVAAGTLPKTTSGKLQRFLCRDGFRAREFSVLAEWSAAEGGGVQSQRAARVAS